LKTFLEEFAAIKAEIPNSKVYKTIKQAAFNNHPVVLYGAGRLGKTILNICRDCGITVDCFCDRNAAGTLEGIDIITPDTLQEEYSNALVIVCSWTFNDEICAILRRMYFPENQIITCPCEYPYYSSLQDFGDHLTGYEWAYNFFTDERSRQLVLDRIHLILCDHALVPNTDCDMYYENSFITLCDNEVFVDGGAYTGDSVKDFFAKMKNIGQGEVYSFEPDKDNYKFTVQSLLGIPNVTIVQKGLWNSEMEVIFFHCARKFSSSFVNDSGAITQYRVPVVSLDGYFKCMPESRWPTFIKMDIEGAEREALLGSAEIIKSRKPKLAICAYHKPEDIYELPQIISSIRNDYRFALCQHTYGSFDTVLYAV